MKKVNLPPLEPVYGVIRIIAKETIEHGHKFKKGKDIHVSIPDYHRMKTMETNSILKEIIKLKNIYV